MKGFSKGITALIIALSVGLAGCSEKPDSVPNETAVVKAEEAVAEADTGWDFHRVAMGGDGFVSGVFATSQEGLYYARTDVGGAYRYDKEREKWISVSGFVSEDDKGLLGISALAYAENSPNKLYLLAGTSYFSNGKT